MTRHVGDLASRLLPRLRHLLPPRTRVLIATSGGPDSQALMDVLGRLRAELDLVLFAVGIDHGLRPDAARELDLAAALAAEHGIPFARRTVSVSPRGNLLEAARRARYA